MAAAARFKITFFGHYLAIIARICTEFDTDAEDGVPQTDLPVKIHIVQKSKMAAAAMLKSVKRPYLGDF